MEQPKIKDRQFLYADDLLKDGQFRDVTLTIAEVHAANTLFGADQKPVEKMALGFAGTEKKLVLNNTNERLVRMATGSTKSDGWAGKKVTLYPVAINAFGEKNVPAIRIRTPEGTPIQMSVRKQLGRDLSGETTQREGK